MPDLAYISTIAPGWTVERQMAALQAAMTPDEWKAVAVYRDEPTPRSRQAHAPGTLAMRDAMLRLTRRPKPGRLLVATLAVLGWGKADFLAVLQSARALQLTIWPADTQAPLAPGCDPDQAAVAFSASRVAGARAKARLVGNARSAEARKAAADLGSARVKDRWGMPSAEWATAALLAEAGAPGKPLAYNTVTARLGGRETAQRRYQAGLKRKARKGKPDAIA